jgi:hypothetical protein
MSEEMRTPRIFRGRVEHAVYRDPIVPVYRENPLIEALPEILPEEDAYRHLRYYPEYIEKHRELSAEIRLHLIYNLNQFFKPCSVHLDLEQRFSRMIRAGYLARNPFERNYWLDTDTRVQSTRGLPRKLRSTAAGFYMVGVSGVGKSTAIESILDLYPQVICHSEYEGTRFSFMQIVWLKLDCPFDGSVKGVCTNFIQELDAIFDTNYYKNYARRGRATTDELLGAMKRLTAIHGIGCLVCDEIQNLSEAKSAGVSRALNFYVQLVNTMGMPVVLVGTYKAFPLLTKEFRQARRASGQGDLMWTAMEEDGEWKDFIKVLWRYQYVKNPTRFAPRFAHTLYDVSQGIVDFAVKAYQLAQFRAIASGEEVVTEELIRSVALDSFSFADDVLRALREKDWEKLRTVEDVALVDMERYYKRALEEERLRRGADADAEEELEDNKTDAPSEASIGKEEAPSSKKDAAKKRSPKKRRKSRCKDIDHLPEDDLRRIIYQAREEDIAPYAALQQAGCLRPVMEFLEGR